MPTMTEKPPFEEIWARIKNRAGHTFFTKTGLRFSYTVQEDRVILNRKNYYITRQDLKKAYPFVPTKGPSQITASIRGPSYVWAILHDAQISMGQY